MPSLGLRNSLGGFITRSAVERDLEVAQRLGHWQTEEDRQLLREHERQLALAKRSAALNQAARVGTGGLLLAAWTIPPLWPLAVVASFRVFPRTSRRILLALLGVTGATVVGSGVLVHQVLESATAPPVVAPAGLTVDSSPQP